MAGYDWKALIQPLTSTESDHLVKILSDPVVVKYFRNIAYESMIEQAMTTIDALIQSPNDASFRIIAAYNKGKLEIAETLLTYLEQANKPSS